MLKKIVTKAIIWFIQAVDVEIEKDGDRLQITVEFAGKPVIQKTVLLRSI
jgi:hypothetical protein